MTGPELAAAADLFMLALVTWREARGESKEARVAVAASIHRRAVVGGWWGRSLLEVIAKPLQYSSMTYPNDPQLVRWPLPFDTHWQECLAIASDVIAGRVASVAPLADSYHDVSISAPSWATPGRFLTQIGRLRFFRVHEGKEGA